ncbi:MAG: hypothetical protein RR900_07245, partial [Ruthenibacterium sp.]
FTTSADMAALLKEEYAMSPEARAQRRKTVTAYTTRYGQKEFMKAVMNVYERAIAEYRLQGKQKFK